ncbi:MAG: DUF4397 domain-containing protein [Chitinophagaceae bacterium]|nr:DUF4397 domain-containing protein [Chitinophagaceae bacterium]
MKKQLLLATALVASIATNAQTARVQVIHNCADLAADSVDVYLDNGILLDNFAFRTATGFIDAPAAGTPIRLSVAPKNSTSVADTFYSVSVTLDPTKKYVLVANGIESASGYTPSSSAVPFRLSVYDAAREAASMSTNTDLLVVHGSTDAPVVDVRAGNSVLVNDIPFGDFNSTGYLSLPTANYIIDITTASGTVVKRYSAPLSTLGLTGASATVVASGFLNPAVNSSGAAFGLWAAPATGGALIPLDETARVQVIHNCADAIADSVDVYLNGSILLDNFAFRTASEFVNAPVGVPVTLGVAPKNSTSVADTIYSLTTTLTSDKRYIIVANGIVSPTGYTPSAAAAPFRLSIYDQGREISTSASDSTDILVIHGSTDAPAVDVNAGSATLVNDIAFGDFASGGYVKVKTSNYTLDLLNAAATTILKRYSAPLSTLSLDGDAITVVASGFLSPAANSNGPAFGLWVALASGGAMIPLPTSTASVTGIATRRNLDIFPNPTTGVLNFNNKGGEKMKKVTLISVTGAVVAEMSDAARGSFDTTPLAKGVYILQAVDQEGNASVYSILKQ